MKVVFTDKARTRLHEIQAYIAFHNIRAAGRTADRIVYAAEMLGDFPKLGTKWRNGKTRALVVPGLPYRVHYVIVGDVVRVIAITHTRQKPPTRF